MQTADILSQKCIKQKWDLQQMRDTGIVNKQKMPTLANRHFAYLENRFYYLNFFSIRYSAI